MESNHNLLCTQPIKTFHEIQLIATEFNIVHPSRRAVFSCAWQSLNREISAL